VAKSICLDLRIRGDRDMRICVPNPIAVIVLYYRPSFICSRVHLQPLNLSKSLVHSSPVYGGSYSHPDIADGMRVQKEGNEMVYENKALNYMKSMYTIKYDQLMAWQEDAKNRTLDIYNPSHRVLAIGLCCH
jgi:hypothetical protein